VTKAAMSKGKDIRKWEQVNKSKKQESKVEKKYLEMHWQSPES
jgi:hypothetical protein